MFRPARPDETQLLVALAVATGLFSDEEADQLLRASLDDLHAGRLGNNGTRHVALVWADDDDEALPLGWAYFSEQEKADRVWDLWWIGVTPERHGQGIGKKLLDTVEHHVRAAGARILIVETSSLPALARTRRFYEACGYARCGVLPDYYGDGDDKVTFAKRVGRSPELQA